MTGPLPISPDHPLHGDASGSGSRDSSSSNNNNNNHNTSPPPYQSSSSSASMKPPLPAYDSTPSPIVPSTSSSSRPTPRRMSSFSDLTTSSSRRSSNTPSTAATTPNLSTPNPFATHRTWRPTPNVPLNIASRHRSRRSMEHHRDQDEERNRWLSEDEGLDGTARAIGRRRRRMSSGEDDSQGPRPGGGGGPGPSTEDKRAALAEAKATLSTAIEAGSSSSSSSSRPRPRRVRSHEATIVVPSPAPAEIGAEDLTVGSQPPRIEDLVPGPTSPTRTIGLGLRTASIDEGERNRASSNGIVPIDPVYEPILQSSSDGGMDIAGVSSQVIPALDPVTETPDRQEDQRQLLDKLRRILGCALCPAEDGVYPPLHHPITLPCGHTLSADHISLPAPPPLAPASDLPHDMFAAQQRQHQQRLNLWAAVMCPIPTCKRYSPNVSVAPVTDLPQFSTGEPHLPSTSGALRGEMLASGVTYYPPPVPPPPAYTPDPTLTEVGSPLLDISVDKILHLVMRELGLTRVDHMHPRQADTDDERSASGDQATPPNAPPRSGQEGEAPQSPLSRKNSKRQRNTLGSPVDLRENSPPVWPFLKELAGIVECDVCAMMLYEPVTTPCQHSFCSKCMSRSLDHSSRCPMCRQDLPSFAFFQDHSVNRVLLTVVKSAFPEEYAERQKAIEQDERDSRLDTPIFVCTLAFPAMPTILHVFEPRYRLMIRRCIESSNPRFGMVLPARAGAGGQGGVMEYGTMLEIQSVQMLPDGRSMVETVGSHRFKLLEKGNLDGYNVGRIERIDDIPLEEEEQLEESAVRSYINRPAASSQPPALTGPLPPPGAVPGGNFTLPMGSFPSDDSLQTTEEYMNICRAFIEQLRSGSAPWLLQRLNNTYGSMPTDPTEFSYWMALIMPIDEYEKARLLPIRSARLRLKLIVHWVESLRSSWWFSSG